MSRISRQHLIIRMTSFCDSYIQSRLFTSITLWKLRLSLNYFWIFDTLYTTILLNKTMKMMWMNMIWLRESSPFNISKTDSVNVRLWKWARNVNFGLIQPYKRVGENLFNCGDSFSTLSRNYKFSIRTNDMITSKQIVYRNYGSLLILFLLLFNIEYSRLWKIFSILENFGTSCILFENDSALNDVSI